MKAKISRYRRGYRIIDILCQSLVLGGSIGVMLGMVLYANHRDQEYFRQHRIASFPSRPEEVEPRTLDYLDQLPPV